MTRNDQHDNANYVKPFGGSCDPHGFYQLLCRHLTWLAAHNYVFASHDRESSSLRAEVRPVVYDAGGSPMWGLESNVPLETKSSDLENEPKDASPKR